MMIPLKLSLRKQLKNVDLTHLAQHWDQTWTLGSVVMNLPVTQKAGNFFTFNSYLLQNASATHPTWRVGKTVI